MRAWAVNAAVARGDLPTAEARWAPLAAEEQRRLEANERGVDVVRLLLVNARLYLARHEPAEALKTLEQVSVLIAARQPSINPDSRELELLRSSALSAEQHFAEAAQHAQRAAELAMTGAIDPRSSAWVGEALVLRARAEAQEGNKSAAATAQEALAELNGNLEPTHPLIAEARQLALPYPDGAEGLP